MYISPTNLPDEWSDIEGFIKKYNFATVITTLPNGEITATHLPINVIHEDGKSILQGHVSKANNQYASIIDHDVLLIFMAGHHYISPSWYTHRNAPTWNYVSIHVHGKGKKLEGEKLIKHLDDLMNQHEQFVENPQRMEDIPKNVLKVDLRGVLGFEIEITKIEASYKLSQNRDDVSYQNIIKNLETINSDNSNFIANEMKIRRS